jgi:hypothetical protein
MILLALGLLAFGVSDLLSGSPGERTGSHSGSELRREVLSIVAGATVAGSITALAGFPLSGVAAVTGCAVLSVSLWLVLNHRFGRTRPMLPLTWVAIVFLALFSIGSLSDPVGGALLDWYSALGFGFVSNVSVDRFVLAFAAAVFALASCNRIVVLMIGLAGSNLRETESRLKGGRFLGPMERLIIGAAIVAGEPATAAIVIAAKGLLRFPEIQRGDADTQPAGEDNLSADANTEYLLLGNSVEPPPGRAAGTLHISNWLIIG